MKKSSVKREDTSVSKNKKENEDKKQPSNLGLNWQHVDVDHGLIRIKEMGL